MIKFEFEDETYYYDKGKFYDRSFFELPEKDSAELYEHYLATIDLRSLEFDEFINLANQLDNGGNYHNCIKIIEKGFEIFFDQRDYAKLMLPKLFRLYRMQNQPQKVIDLWKSFWCKKTDRIASSALYTVIGAAYCDLKSADEAEYFANRAYGLQGGKADEYLSNLYMRINALKN